MAALPPPPPPPGERIARRIARAGVCSRRDAEKLIAEGRVAVNGVTITSPALNVGADDAITIDGAALPEAERTRLWRHHKRAGRLTTSRDTRGRATVFDDLPGDLPRVVTVGRLDYNTEGLLLLTNDGALKRKLELPATGWRRRYRVRVHGPVDEDKLAALAQGITLDGIRYGPVEAHLERRTGTNAWLAVTLREGKYREVRRILEHLGLTVTRLIRVSFGPFQLGALPPGATEEVPARVIANAVGGAFARPAPRAPARPRRPVKRPGVRHAHRRRTP